MAQTTTRNGQCPPPSATFNEDVYRAFVLRLKERFATVGLLGGLYGVDPYYGPRTFLQSTDIHNSGVLTILSVLSVYSLTRCVLLHPNCLNILCDPQA